MTFKGVPCPCCGRPMPETVEQKLERLIDRTGGPDACWPWTGTRLNKAGYGVIDMYGWGRAWQLRAHRAAYEQAHGPITGGLSVLHRCDNRVCCNPAHLFLGTREDNIRDMWAKGRQSKYDRMPKGEAVGTSTLDEARVLELRRRFGAGETAAGLGAAFGVSQATAWNVIHGVTWKHLPGAQPRRGRGKGAHVARVYDPATQPRGEAMPAAVLTAGAVLEMRHRYAAGEAAVDLAAEYGVAETSAWNAIHGVTWAHVPDAQPKNVGRRGWPKGKPRKNVSTHDASAPSRPPEGEPGS